MSTACVCDDVLNVEATQKMASDSAVNWRVTLLGADQLPLTDGIPTGSTVYYALLNWDRSALLIAQKTSDEGDPDADWPNAVMVVRWTNVETAGLDSQDAWLEVKIEDQDPAFRRIRIEKSLIVAT